MNDTIQVLQHNEMGQAMWRKRFEEMGSHLLAFHLLMLLIGLSSLNSGMHIVLQVCYYYTIIIVMYIACTVIKLCSILQVLLKTFKMELQGKIR